MGFLAGAAGFGLLKSCRQEKKPELTPTSSPTLPLTSTQEPTRIVSETVEAVPSPIRIPEEIPSPSPTPGLVKEIPLSPLPEEKVKKIEEINLFAEVILPALKRETQARRREKEKDKQYLKRVDEEFNRRRINFLLLGTGTEKAGEEVGFLTDSLQLFSFDEEEGNLDILSLHRDTEAPEVARFLGKDVHFRINDAYQIGGFPLIREIVEDATGLSVDFVATLKMEVFQQLVDEVFGGSLEIDLPREINDLNMGYFPAGKQVLDGDKALKLARARFYGSNYDRNLAQQLLIKAMLADFQERNLGEKAMLLGRLLRFYETRTQSSKIKTDFTHSFFLNLGKEILKTVWQERPSPSEKYKFGLPEIDKTFVFASETGMLEPAGDPEDMYRLKVKSGKLETDPLDYWSLLRFKAKEQLAPELLTQEKPEEVFLLRLAEILPSKPRALTYDEEKEVESLIREAIGIEARVVLEGKRLPTVYGMMGTEQHLERFPGDQASEHDEFPDEGIRYVPGAYGYFAESREEFERNPKLKQIEKYYVAVRTWQAQDFRRRFNNEKEKVEHFWQWFRHRKMLVINPGNGRVVVVSVRDAGPAERTGKEFGGSPEIMDRLGLKGGLEKGLVLLLFIDDPYDKIPLGPRASDAPESLVV